MSVVFISLMKIISSLFFKLFFFSSFSFPGFCVFFPFWVCLGRRELWKDISGRDRTKEDIKNPSHVRPATNGRGSLAEKKKRDKVECYSNSIRLVAPTRKSAQLKKSDVGTSRRAENVVGRSVSPAEELKVRSREMVRTSFNIHLSPPSLLCVSEREEIDHFKS